MPWAWVRQTLRHCSQEEVSPSAGEEGDPSSQDQVQESPGEKVPGRSQVHPQESLQAVPQEGLHQRSHSSSKKSVHQSL